jgi:hypothetical protein
VSNFEEVKKLAEKFRHHVKPESVKPLAESFRRSWPHLTQSESENLATFHEIERREVKRLVDEEGMNMREAEKAFRREHLKPAIEFHMKLQDVIRHKMLSEEGDYMDLYHEYWVKNSGLDPVRVISLMEKERPDVKQKIERVRL